MPVDPTNVVGRRIAAWFIDGVVFVIIYNVLGAVFGSADNVTNRNFAGDTAAAQRFCDNWNATKDGFCFHNGGEVTAVTSWSGGIWIFLALVVIFIVYQGLLGASLGKLAMSLRIVKSDGSRAGVGSSAIRTVLWIVDAITCGLPIVGGILIFSTKGHRRVGDMAADTYIVHVSQVGQPVILPGDPGWGGYQSGPYQPVGPIYGQPFGGGAQQPGQPVIGPPSGPTTGPPSQPGASTPWAPTTPLDGPSAGSSGWSAPSSSGDYEADTPIWDDARRAYIQYDTARAAWLEFDDATKEWKPIST